MSAEVSGPTLSVIMPALNEEGNLRGAVAAVREAVGRRFARHEILIFDDGSTDRTGALADALAVEDPAVRVVHNGRTRGLGWSYRRGVELARHEYVVMVPGDNEIPAASLADMFDRVGTADIVAPYFVNAAIRPLGRRLLSAAFTRLVNALFGLRLAYFNGPCIHRRELVLLALPRTSGFAYMAVLLVRLLVSGFTVTEVGTRLGERTGGRSKALRLRNWLSVAASLASLFVEVRLRRRRWTRPSPSSGPAVTPR